MAQLGVTGLLKIIEDCLEHGPRHSNPVIRRPCRSVWSLDALQATSKFVSSFDKGGNHHDERQNEFLRKGSMVHELGIFDWCSKYTSSHYDFGSSSLR